jgi:hypothetical protein
MEHISSDILEQYVESTLYDGLLKSLNPELEGLVRYKCSAFGRTPNGRTTIENGFIGKGRKVPPRNKSYAFEIAYEEKHVLIHKKVDIKWIKSMEQLNYIEKDPKIIWWFGKANSDLKQDILDLLGEFRTFQISDDINPKVSFFIETKKSVLFE